MTSIVLGAALLGAACDHGSMVVVENQTDREYLARATGHVSVGNVSHVEEIVAILAPNSKLGVVELPFAGGFQIQGLDILAADCSVIDSRPFYRVDGTYVVITDAAKVERRDEFPQNGTLAERTDRCRLTPESSPSAMPSASISP
ncbi:MAG: hypothetical protein ABJC39_12750 [Chloroflexota bacterium]